MTLPTPTGQAVDLRAQPVDKILDHVARSLQVRLLPDTVVRKRRSVGARTNRNTWVRIERRLLGKIPDQGWNGTESAAHLKGVMQPAWHGCVVWRDAAAPVMWRADETSLLPAAPVGGAVLSDAPELPDEWWMALNASLDALAAQTTARVATPDTETITQALVTETVQALAPEVLDTTVERWTPAHADLNWANMTALSSASSTGKTGETHHKAWTPPPCGPVRWPSPPSPNAYDRSVGTTSKAGTAS
ncbi:hypothetical protein STPH1_3083 [Streptomyces sp. OM5714]|nr:hypothetical protein STPH1_3083 [Streptomyces sp. OM5714]